MNIAMGKAWTIFVALAAALCLAPPAAAQTSETAFTRQMAERIRDAFPGRAVEMTEPLQLRLDLTPEPALINVGRLFNFCASSTADECEATIAHFIAVTTEGLNDLSAPITREQLRLVVRNTEYCDYLREDRQSDQPGPIMRQFIAGLCTLIMADFPTRMRSVTAEELRGMGLDPEAAWTLAERQTLADLPRPEALDGLEGSIVMVADFDYVTSLLLHTEGWQAARARYGDILAAVPASDAMIVARAATIDDMAGLNAAVRRHFETAERGVSPTIYRFGASGWVPAE